MRYLLMDKISGVEGVTDNLSFDRERFDLIGPYNPEDAPDSPEPAPPVDPLSAPADEDEDDLDAIEDLEDLQDDLPDGFEIIADEE